MHVARVFNAHVLAAESWVVLSSPPSLAENEVHVWKCNLTIRPSASCLAPGELHRAQRFLQERDRIAFAACRTRLRELLGHYLSLAPAALEFQANAFGKPALAGPAARSGLEFNVSHSHGLALIAVAYRRALGIDLEKIRPETATEEIAERYFARGEVERLQALPAAERTRAFFTCWTRKEAYIKARGDGLSRALDSFEVSFGPGTFPAILRADDEPQATQRWQVTPLESGTDYCACLVVEGQGLPVRCLQSPGPVR